MPRKRKIVVAVDTEDESNQENVQDNAKPHLVHDKNANKMADVVVEAQKNASYHEKCIKEMRKLYDQIEHDDFMKYVHHFLMFSMSHTLDNAFGETQLQFWAKFLTSFDSDEGTHPVLVDLFNWLLATTSEDPYLRFRLCQFVNSLFNAFGAEAQLDDDICTNIQKIMIERLRDVNMNVRQQAIYALQRLQNPDDPEDRVLKCYTFHMKTDPNPKVRMAVVTSIAKTLLTIPHIVGRLWDVDELVRRHTYVQMSRYSVKNYKVAQRIKILDQGLNDHSEKVRKVVTNIMLPNWIESYQRDYVKFLSALKLDATEDEITKFKAISIQALQEIFKARKPDEIIAALKLNTSDPENVEKCMSLDDLTVESVVFWQAVIKYLSETEVEDVDEVLPDMKDFAVFLKIFVETNIRKLDENDDRLERLSFQFILLSLLEILNG